MDQFLLISSLLLWIVVLFNLLFTLAVVSQVNHSMNPQSGVEDRVNLDTLKFGEPAPFFIATTLEGTKVLLNDYSRQFIVFIFISSRCRSYRERILKVENFLPKAWGLGILFVYVCNDDELTTEAFFCDLNTNAQVLVAPQTQNSFINDYKIPATPYFCLNNREGIIQEAGYFDQKWVNLVMEWIG